MARLIGPTGVGIFVRDLKTARSFYTRKLGLRVRESDPKFEYLHLGTTKGGQDAGIDLWQPRKETFGPMYESALKSIGTVTGIGFRTGNLAKTIDLFSRRGVRIERSGQEAGERFARLWDGDGNVVFVEEPDRPKVRRAGLLAVDFATIACRDAERTGAFLRTALGMKGRRVRGENFAAYRVNPKSTSIVPFTPTKEMYDNPADYDADLAHIGEETSIGFRTDDAYALQETLLSRGVRFKQKAEKRPWGGIAARFYDPDDNVFMVYQEG